MQFGTFYGLNPNQKSEAFIQKMCAVTKGRVAYEIQNLYTP